MIFTTENFLKDNGDKIPADQKPAIEQALQKLKDAHKAGDIAAIDAATASLNQVMQAASAQMYSQAGGAQPGAGQGFNGANGGFNGNAGGFNGANANNAGQQGQSSQSNDSTVQDADFEEVK